MTASTHSTPYGVVYRIVCKANGKAYVGQAVQPLARRFYQHMSGSRGCGKHLHRAVAKYGRMTGRRLSAETRAKIGAAQAGRPKSAETRARMSAARRRRVVSP